MTSPQSLTSDADPATGIRPSSRDGSLQPSASVKDAAVQEDEKQVGSATLQSSSNVDSKLFSSGADEACVNRQENNQSQGLQVENEGLRERLQEAEAQNEKM